MERMIAQLSLFNAADTLQITLGDTYLKAFPSERKMKAHLKNLAHRVGSWAEFDVYDEYPSSFGKCRMRTQHGTFHILYTKPPQKIIIRSVEKVSV